MNRSSREELDDKAKLYHRLHITRVIKAQRQILGFTLEIRKNKAAKPLEISYLYQVSDKQRGDLVLSMTAVCIVFHHTSDCNELLSPPALYTSLCQPCHSCLHLSSAGIKSRRLLSIGASLSEFYFSF